MEDSETSNSEDTDERRIDHGLSRRDALRVGAAGVAGLAGPVGVTSRGVAASGGDPGPRSYYNVKSYGATGDGETDDTAPIQAAIDDAAAAGGGVVYVPQGDFRITETLRVDNVNDVALKGVGAGSTLFTDSDTLTLLHVGSDVAHHAFYNDYRAAATGGELDSRGAQHCQVLDVTLDRSVAPAETATGLHVHEANFTVVRGVTVHNQGRGIAVGVEGGAGIPAMLTSIVDCTLTAAGSQFGAHGFPDAAIKFLQSADTKVHDTYLAPTNVGIDMVEGSNGILINECTVAGESSYAYGVRASGNGFARYVANSVLSDARSAQVRIEAPSLRFSLTGCWLGATDPQAESDDVRSRGVDVQDGARTIQIVGNRIGDQTREGIRVRGDDVAITKNHILDNNASGASDVDSVLVEGGADGTQGTRLVDNRISSPHDRYGVTVSGAVNDFVVLGNDLGPSGDDCGDCQGLNVTATGSNRVVAHNLRPESDNQTTDVLTNA